MKVVTNEAENSRKIIETLQEPCYQLRKRFSYLLET